MAAEPAEPIFDSSPLSHANKLSDHDRAATAQSLAHVGVRLFPYPYSSAISVLSDLDSSLRSRYDAYIGILVRDLGLDFGDSIWLYPSVAPGPPPKASGHGFFSPHLNFSYEGARHVFQQTRTFSENVAEYHSGCVDHFHAYLPRGPRVVLFDRLERDGASITTQIGETERNGFWSCSALYVFTLGVVTRSSERMEIQSVRLEEAAETRQYDYSCSGNMQIGEAQWLHLFDISPAERSDVLTPTLVRTKRITLIFETAEFASRVQLVTLSNASGATILDRLRLLRNRYNVEIPLVTTHASYHFRDEYVARQRDDAQRQQLAAGAGPKLALSGNIHLEGDGLRLSTDADDPGSMHKVFPEVRDELQLRFVVPGGFTREGASGLSPLDLVRPANTRSNASIYVVARIMPEASNSAPDTARSLRSNFSARVRSVLDQSAETPGLCWPIYTHLGALEQELVYQRSTQIPLPSPYLDLAPLHDLQDRVFGMSNSGRTQTRLWFTRASVLYDYALILRSIAANVTRQGDDIVRISSWFDQTLGRKLPVSPSQLFGLTFYVRDASVAKIYLDDQELLCLVRNAADETGRESVTIAECEIKHVVFENVDPAARDQAILTNSNWNWTPARGSARAFGRLTVAGEKSNGPEIAIVQFKFRDMHPLGTQIFMLDVRADSGVEFAVQIESQTGARFCFGTQDLIERIDSKIVARYIFSDRAKHTNWQTLVVPLYNLVWGLDSAPGDAMPNHALNSLSILCRGPSGAFVDISRLGFFRPRATTLRTHSGQHFCLGGRVASFRAGQIVHAAEINADKWDFLSETIDDRGYFCFGSLPRGLYRVWSRQGADIFSNSNGAMVDLCADTMSLVLRN